MKVISSRERVIAAINHKETERIPIDLGGTGVSGIHAKTYHNLLRLLNVSKPIRIENTKKMSVYIDNEVSKRFQIDVVALWPLYDSLEVRRDAGFKDWVTPKGTPVKISRDFNPEKDEKGNYYYKVEGYKYKFPRYGYYFELMKPAYDWIETPEDVKKIEYPIMSNEEKQWIKLNSERLRSETDKFIVTDIMGGWCDIAGPMLGNAKFYMDIIANKPMIHALFRKLNDVWMARIDALVESAGDNIDAVIMYNDLGGDTGGLYKNETVKEMIIPYIREFYDYVRKVSNYHIIFHSDGSIYQYIPDLIDAGVNILNPVQVGIKDMEPERLKKEFGKDLTFWGGAVDPQRVLAFKTPEEVKEQAKRNAEIFMKDGGFVFTQPQSIQPDVPAENVIALYDAAIEVSEN